MQNQTQLFLQQGLGNFECISSFVCKEILFHEDEYQPTTPCRSRGIIWKQRGTMWRERCQVS